MADTSHKHMQHISGSRVMTVIIGILLAVLGIIFFMFPLASVFFTGVFIIVGLLLYGIYMIISFFATPKFCRDGWQLASGIILTVCGGVILASSASNIVVSFAIILGIVALMIGINQIIGYAALRGTAGAGFILASGIINVLLALFLIFAPFVAAAAVGIVQGVYLCFAGGALIVEGFAKRPVTMDELFNSPQVP